VRLGRAGWCRGSSWAGLPVTRILLTSARYCNSSCSSCCPSCCPTPSRPTICSHVLLCAPGARWWAPSSRRAAGPACPQPLPRLRPGGDPGVLQLGADGPHPGHPVLHPSHPISASVCKVLGGSRQFVVLVSRRQQSGPVSSDNRAIFVCWFVHLAVTIFFRKTNFINRWRFSEVLVGYHGPFMHQVLKKVNLSGAKACH